jgi:hypothetical protein
MSIEKFMYFRKDGFPVGCVAYRIKDGVLEYGVSSYNAKDPFDKKVAREVAEGRLNKCPMIIRLSNGARYREVELSIAHNIYNLSLTQAGAGVSNSVVKAAHQFLSKYGNG